MTWYTTHFQLKKEDEKTPTVGVEPTTFGLEVQRAIHCATGTNLVKVVEIAKQF